MIPDPRPLELVVLGAGPAYTDRVGAAGACYLLRRANDAILLDLGQGSFPRLAHELEPSRLQAVLISHLHPDHFVDLVSLRHYLRWHLHPPRRVRVLGPVGLARRLDDLHAEPGFSAATLDVEGLSGSVHTIGPFTVQASLVAHTDESYGFRVAIGDGPGLVYSGDCGRAEDLDVLVRPGDTLLCEVSFGVGPVVPDAAHLAGPDVGRLARRTEARDVLLTHLLMGHDRDATIASVRAEFDGPVRFVTPGDRVTVGPA
jgi:Metal-dependent hydrolases of the beta-lactamase superfamily III